MIVYCQVQGEQITQIATGFAQAPFPDAIEAPREILGEPDRWFYIGGVFTCFPKIQTSSRVEGQAGTMVEITASLSPDTLDTEVRFSIDSESVTEPVVNGQAAHSFIFAEPGVYPVIASSVHHGRTVVEVNVQ